MPRLDRQSAMWTRLLFVCAALLLCAYEMQRPARADVAELSLSGVPVTPSNPVPVQDVGRSSLATGQVTVAATATLVVAARAGRGYVLVQNLGTTAVYLGGAGVTTSTGMLLQGVAGAIVKIDAAAAIYGIVASGTQAVSFGEVY